MGRIISFSFIALLVIGLTVDIAFAKGPGKGQGKGPGKETGNVVSQSVHKAQAEGLKGKDIASAAHEAIEERTEGKEEGMAETKKERMKKKHHEKHKHGKGATPTPLNIKK